MSRSPHAIVVIGASTGGTRVLPQILAALPSLTAAYVVIQHMPRFINASFARTLAQRTPGEVKLAEDRDSLCEGRLVIVPSEVHCHVVLNRTVHLEEGPKVNFVCPAVDVTMQSLRAPQPGCRLVGVVLSGMGRDGAAGLLHIKHLGGVTLAQNEATCAVYGMPAEAVRLGAVDFELPPAGIAEKLAELTAPSSRTGAVPARENVVV